MTVAELCLHFRNFLAKRELLSLRNLFKCLDNPAMVWWTQGEESLTVAAVGTWDHQVHVVRVPSLTPLATEPLGGDIIPRSVLFTAFEGVKYLLVALGNFCSLPGCRLTTDEMRNVED